MRKQNGGALLIAIFIIIVTSLLGASILSLQQDSAQEGIYDVYAVRASLAAYSANEVAMLTLFANEKENDSLSLCLGKKEKVAVLLPENTEGFVNCKAHYTCQSVASSIGDVYTVLSSAICQVQGVNIYREMTTKVMR